MAELELETSCVDFKRHYHYYNTFCCCSLPLKQITKNFLGIMAVLISPALSWYQGSSSTYPWLIPTHLPRVKEEESLSFQALHSIWDRPSGHLLFCSLKNSPKFKMVKFQLSQLSQHSHVSVATYIASSEGGADIGWERAKQIPGGFYLKNTENPCLKPRRWVCFFSPLFFLPVFERVHLLPSFLPQLSIF